ncbi:MAG: hypothetical protein Q8L90_08355 [Bacteroidota bacterium]|nr:hypothetical protein [Bacteroidota bacterium]
MKNTANFTSIIISCCFSLMIFVSCESPEQKTDDAFELVKEEKMMAKDSFIAEREITKVKSKVEVAMKNESVDEWKKFKFETEKRILINEKKIKEIKGIPDSNTKLYRQVVTLEKNNNDLRRQMDEYYEEMKVKWESFKVKINHDVNEIGIELQDIQVNNKK